MTPLTVSSFDPFDDSEDRAAFQRYGNMRGWEVICASPYSTIDCYARNPNKVEGSICAFELMCNAIWTDQLEYPTHAIHVPERKFKYFRRVLCNRWEDARPDEIWFGSVGKGFVVILNRTRTRAALIPFAAIVQDFDLFMPEILQLNYSSCPVRWVPTSYITHYINIPEANKELSVGA